MSSFLVSHLHSATLVATIVRSNSDAEMLMSEFMGDLKKQALNEPHKFHPVDQDFVQVFKKINYVKTFAHENFEILIGLFSKVIVEHINSLSVMKDNQEDWNHYRIQAAKKYSEAKNKVNTLKLMEFIKLLHCYKYQISDFKEVENTVVWKLLELVERNAYSFFHDEYMNVQYAI